jgi:hypothetical protein
VDGVEGAVHTGGDGSAEPCRSPLEPLKHSNAVKTLSIAPQCSQCPQRLQRFSAPRKRKATGGAVFLRWPSALSVA